MASAWIIALRLLPALWLLARVIGAGYGILSVVGLAFSACLAVLLLPPSLLVTQAPLLLTPFHVWIVSFPEVLFGLSLALGLAGPVWATRAMGSVVDRWLFGDGADIQPMRSVYTAVAILAFVDGDGLLSFVRLVGQTVSIAAPGTLPGEPAKALMAFLRASADALLALLWVGAPVLFSGLLLMLAVAAMLRLSSYRPWLVQTPWQGLWHAAVLMLCTTGLLAVYEATGEQLRKTLLVLRSAFGP